MRHGSDKTLQVGYANHFYRSAHKFEQICRHRLRRQNVGYSNFSQPQSHLSFCVLLQYLVERRRVVTQLGKLGKIILIKQELLLLVYELNRSGLLAENEKIRPILAQLEKLLLCDLSPSTNDSVKN